MLEKNRQMLLSPLNGTIVSLQEVSDPVFSSYMMGRGFAVKPKDGRMCSPVKGTVTSVAESKHAYVIKTQSGMEMLIHVGLDTVYLEGKPFKCAVKSGDKVKVGDLLCSIDLDMIRDKGVDTIVPITFPKLSSDSEISIAYGEAKIGDKIMSIVNREIKRTAGNGFFRKNKIAHQAAK